MEPLKRSERIREYRSYPSSTRGKIALTFLQEETLGHRELDRVILGQNPAYSHGYQSMGVLHYQGIVKEHHGALSGKSVQEVIDIITVMENNAQLLGDLLAFINVLPVDAIQLEKELEQSVTSSLQTNGEERRERLSRYDGKPLLIQTISYSYKRNPDVVAEALSRAGGICENCRNPAPFLRRSDRSPYLEVHHVTSLSNEGLDTLDNVLALCPNCHRKIHHA